jgi:hypothetical protein
MGFLHAVPGLCRSKGSIFWEHTGVQGGESTVFFFAKLMGCSSDKLILSNRYKRTQSSMGLDVRVMFQHNNRIFMNEKPHPRS